MIEDKYYGWWIWPTKNFKSDFRCLIYESKELRGIVSVKPNGDKQ